MSRDWSKKELQIASEQMKKTGHMTYEEFCEHLKTHPSYITKHAIDKEVIKEYKKRQLDDIHMLCPRCGEDKMRTPVHYNCLSRQTDIYVCEECGVEEAIYAMKGVELPIEYWDLYARLE